MLTIYNEVLFINALINFSGGYSTMLFRGPKCCTCCIRITNGERFLVTPC